MSDQRISMSLHNPVQATIASTQGYTCLETDDGPINVTTFFTSLDVLIEWLEDALVSARTLHDLEVSR